MPTLRAGTSRPSVPDGLRVYAIGDIHGRADLLENLLARIDKDIDASPPSGWVEIFLGDYIDRGPDSRQVLDLLIARRRKHPIVCLKGNHETFVEEFLKDPGVLQDWARLGGTATLLSYGIPVSSTPDARGQEELSAAFAQALPATHRRFLGSLALSFTCGDYFFVHAGARPGIPLGAQRQEDLLWIRDDFLRHRGDFGKVVVHGHTPVSRPDLQPNRVNIDTGAYVTGQLTCLRLDRDSLEFV